MARAVLGLAVALAVAGAAAAQPFPADPKNRVSFSVERSREVANDWVTAVVGTSDEDSDAARESHSLRQLVLVSADLFEGFETPRSFPAIPRGFARHADPGAPDALGGEHVWAPPADISPSNPGREFSVSASGAGHRDYPAVCHRRGSFEGGRKNATPLLQGALLRMVREVMSA